MTIHYSVHHSVLKFFTGFAVAALMACKLIVSTAINKASTAATINIHQAISILYEKSCSQLCMAHHASGNATNEAINTSFKKSFESIATTLPTLAPSTLRILISLERCCVVYAARPNKPIQAIKMASEEKIVNIFCVACSCTGWQDPGQEKNN